MATRHIERATLWLKWSMALLLAVNVAVIADIFL